MRILLIVLLIPALLARAGSPAAAQTGSQTTSAVDHAVFDRILRESVRAVRVDYLNIRRHQRSELRDYLDRLAAADVEALAPDEQLAFYFNLYNATVIHAVANRFKAGYSASENDFSLFKEPLVRTAGRAISLNDLENKIIRARFNEPRIHVALVCGARSCPPLLPRAYVAKDLDTVLTDNMRRFLNDGQRNRIDTKRKQLQLSQVFNWYSDDFEGKPKLASYVNRYTPRDVAGFQVTFLEYSWTLNLAAPRSGRWIEITSNRATLQAEPSGRVIASVPKGEVLAVQAEQDGWLRVERATGTSVGWLKTAATKPFVVPD